jgi:hypothetical protein
MQGSQPATAPPAPATAPPPGATATVLLPGGPIPLEQLPRTAAEVEGLRERREILRDHLSRASNRRDGLVSDLNRATSPEARAGIQQRLNLLDERILQIERDQAATERLLSSAPAEVLALTAAPRSDGGMVGEGEATMAAFSTFGVGVLLAVLIGRLRRRRARRRGRLAEVTEDPRLERLTQAVDAIAEEVERIGEGQRFVTQLLAERREPVALKGEQQRGV